MKNTFYLFVALFLCSTISQGQTDPVITAWMLNTTGATGYNGIDADIQSVCYDNDFVYISTTGIPSYTIGPWQGNPNTPTNQNFGFKIPRNPQPETGTRTTVGLGQQGVCVNGVVIFSPSDGRSYNNDGIWDNDAWDTEGSTMDAASGHANANGTYHTHAAPNELYSSDSTQHSPIIGYAFDGYPIYGPYGYSNPNNANSPIKRIQSSYRERNITDRTSLPDGTSLSPAQYGPAINSTYPLGYFMQDHVYDSLAGDLDEFNGRFTVTPEYPGGTYAYFTTIESDHSTPAFPYFFGPYEFYGQVETDNTVPGGGSVTAPAGCTAYTSVQEIENASIVGISVYPNPAHEHLYLLTDQSANYMITLYNAVGQQLKQIQFNDYSLLMDVSDLESGMYLLYFEDQDSGKRYNSKFIKQK